MAQFDVYENLDPSSAEEYPYWLDIQHPLHSRLQSRLVIPLSRSCDHVIGRLEPLVYVQGEKFRAATAEMVALPVEIFGKKVENLSDQSGEVIDAVDFLITGF